MHTGNAGPKYLDLFAGAGGLSEGFIRAGFSPIAHIEMNKAACFTLKTRLSYWWLKANNQLEKYDEYMEGNLSREELYDLVPKTVIDTVIESEISKSNLEEIFKKIEGLSDGEKIKLIIGGPPCQAYSVVGRSRQGSTVREDQRNNLYLMYAEFLKRFEPEMFVFENVIGLLSAKDEDNANIFEKMITLFKTIGYCVEYKVLNAKDYGVLQDRKRIILIGWKNSTNFIYPNIVQIKNNCMVDEIFKDLPKIKAGGGNYRPTSTLNYCGEYLYESGIKQINKEKVTLHYARKHCKRDLEIYKRVVNSWNNDEKRLMYDALPARLITHKNTESFLDRFKVVPENREFSHTVVAHLSKDGHYYIHPDIKQNRSLTPREAARLQSFPDNYYFESVSGISSMTAAFMQIGNAVPVRMAEAIATSIKVQFDQFSQ